MTAGELEGMVSKDMKGRLLKEQGGTKRFSRAADGGSNQEETQQLQTLSGEEVGSEAWVQERQKKRVLVTRSADVQRPENSLHIEGRIRQGRTLENDLKQGLRQGLGQEAGHALNRGLEEESAERASGSIRTEKQYSANIIYSFLLVKL